MRLNPGRRWRSSAPCILPPHNEDLCKAASIIAQVDVLLGNLEDAIPAEAKDAARAGFIRVARENDFSNTGLWTRVNALNARGSSMM